MNETTERERTALEIELADLVNHQVQRTADWLRHVADRIEREGRRIEHVGIPGNATYAAVAASVLDELRAMSGNLMTSSLVQAAYQADEERIRTS